MGDSKGQTKGQKVASALYLLTSFFPESEPLKWRVRSLSADIVSDIIKDKLSVVKEIMNLLTLAKNAGLVSDINYDIIVREFPKVEHEQKTALNNLFPREILATEKLPAPESVKDKTSEISGESKQILREFGPWSKPSVKKTGRQNVIITLLKRKKEIMIKDVSSFIEDCSEKTIQRELLSMVAAGILRKIGEKRWSRYTLA